MNILNAVDILGPSDQSTKIELNNNLETETVNLQCRTYTFHLHIIHVMIIHLKVSYVMQIMLLIFNSNYNAKA